MYMEFRDLGINDNGKELVNIERIRIYYSLKELILGNIMNSLKEIRIVKSTFNFDSDKDKDLIDLLNKISSGERTKIKLPDIKISGKNLKVKISNSKGLLEFSRLFFTLTHKDAGTKLIVKGSVKTSIDKSKLLSGNAKFSIKGFINDNLEITNTLFVFKALENSFISSKKISLRGSYKSKQFELQKVEDSRPLDINLIYSNIDKKLKINFNSENFIPLDYFEPKNIDNSILQWLGSSVSGTGNVIYNTVTTDLTYSADITGQTNNSSIPTQIDITTSLKGDKTKVDFRNLKIATKDGSLVFKGMVPYNNFLPSGNLNIYYNNILTKVNANLTLKNINNKLDIIGNKILINKIQLFNFKTFINFFKKDFDFKTTFNIDNNNLLKEQIVLDGNIQFKPDIFLNLSLNTLNMPLNSIFNIIPFKYDQYLNFLPNLSLTTNLFISTDFSRFSFSGSNIHIFSQKGDDLVFSAFGNNDTLEFNNIIAKINNKNLQGSVKTTINNRSITTNMELLYEENPYNFNIMYYPNRGIYFKGNYGISGSLYKQGSRSEFHLNLKDFPVPLKESTSILSIETNGYYKEINNWQANIEKMEILDFPNLIPGNKLSIKGSLTDTILNFTSINYEDPLSKLNGTGLFSYNIFTKKEINGEFHLNSNNGEEYKGNLTLKDELINFQSDFTKAHLNRFEKLPVSGLVSGGITLNGSFPKPNISMTLQLEKGEYNSSPLEIETSLEISKNKFDIGYFRLKYINQVLQKGKGEINLQTGDFLLQTEYLGALKKKNFQAFVDITGNIHIPESRPTFQEVIKSNFNSVFTFKNIFIDNNPSDPWNLNLNQVNQKISFNGGPKAGLSGFLDKSGNFKILSKEGLPLRGEGSGQIADGMIDLKIKNMEADYTLLNLIPYDRFLEFTNGTIYGYLNVAGQLKDPLFNGKFRALNGEANVFMVTDRIDPFNGDIIIKDRKITVGPEILTNNGSSVKVGIDLTINKWIPSTYNFNIKTVNKDTIHIVYDVPKVGLDVDGYFFGNININKDEYGINISSKLTADDCIINLGSSSETKSNEMPINFNMEFSTGKKVQFIWPSNAIPILRATSEPGQKINLIIDMLNGTYSLTGEVNIKYGDINYFQKSFYLSEGALVFDENESKFDPVMGFKAQIKEVDSQGELVNISLIQDKLPVSRFAPRFESVPPLSDVEIFSILGAGVFTQIGNEQIDLSSALLLTGDLVTQFAIIRNFETKVRDIFNLDLFSIRTQMIQNIIIDRFIENDTAEQELYLDSFGRYLDNTTLYLGKYIGDDIFLQALLQINNQPYLNNDLNATNKLLIESSISLEWKTPLFLLGLSVKPDFVDPLSSIQSTSLELSWGYSY